MTRGGGYKNLTSGAIRSHLTCGRPRPPPRGAGSGRRTTAPELSSRFSASYTEVRGRSLRHTRSSRVYATSCSMAHRTRAVGSLVVVPTYNFVVLLHRIDSRGECVALERVGDAPDFCSDVSEPCRDRGGQQGCVDALDASYWRGG